MRITEDGVWRYYNCPDPEWSEKCRRCRDKVAESRRPVEECINCWKIEVWGLSFAMRRFRHALEAWPTSCAQEQTYLVDALARRGLRVIAKAARAPIVVVRTGVPQEAYPSEQIDNLLILYAGSIAERDALRREAQHVLGLPPAERSWVASEAWLSETPNVVGACVPEELHEIVAPVLPVRRGCWRYDEVLGPWETWYPVDLDYPTRPDRKSSW